MRSEKILIVDDEKMNRIITVKQIFCPRKGFSSRKGTSFLSVIQSKKRNGQYNTDTGDALEREQRQNRQYCNKQGRNIRAKAPADKDKKNHQDSIQTIIKI